MLVLGIESTCDETACAVVEDGRTILSNVVTSQIDLHREYGGVVPELACRRHVDLLIPVIDEALKKAEVTLDAIDLIAVAHGPGLIGALILGLNAAKTLALSLSKPFVGVNHIEAHLYAPLLTHPAPHALFPCIGVVLSGGHTSLVQMGGIGSYKLIGQTTDDAIGEAFDKVAKVLDLPYPGGPEIEALAKEGNPKAYTFKMGQIKKRPFDFSFSGIKTAVLYAAKGQDGKLGKQDALSRSDKCNIAATFQETAFQDVIKKTLAAAESFGSKTLVLGGGVTHNTRLKELFALAAPDYEIVWPQGNLSLDNAAMIAGLGFHKFLEQGHGDPLSLEPMTRIPFSR